MIRPTMLALCIVALTSIALFAGHAWAETADPAPVTPGPGALLVSAKLPQPDSAHPDMYRTIDAQLGAFIDTRAAASASDGPPGGTSVTGSVQPVVTIVSAEPGTVSEIIINTAERDPGSLLFTVRTSLASDGRAVELDEDTWHTARAALAAAASGTGTVWSRAG